MNSGLTNSHGYRLTLKAVATGGGGSGIDAVARTAAAQAQSNVNAITPNPNEIIPDGTRIYTPVGIFENNSGGPITLGATDPATEASLLADGLVAATVNTETGTNLTLAAGAFADAENPLLSEAVTGYTAAVTGLGIPKHPSDLLTYESAGGKRFTWAAGDASGAPLALISTFDPSASGGHLKLSANAGDTLLADPNPRILRTYTLSDETISQPDAAAPARNGVNYVMAAPAATTDAIRVIRHSAAEIYLTGPDLWLNDNDEGRKEIMLTSNNAGTAWVASI